MKLLMITRTLAEFASIQGEIAEIGKLGIDQTVLSPRRWGGREGEIMLVKPNGFQLLFHDCWFSGTSSIRVGNHLHFYPGIAKVIGQQKWDLVHIDEEPFNLATYHALRACRKFDVPAIFTLWQNIDKFYPPPFDYFERYAFKNVAGAIAGSKEIFELLRKRGFRGPAKQIGHGLDPVVFSKQDVTELRRKLVPENSFVVGFVGRIHWEKGLDTLVKALAQTPPNTVLVLLGRGPYRTELEKLIARLELQKRVYWVPWIPSDQVAQYMNIFDVFVLPSVTRPSWKEQFGRVLIEAMACETCVIGSDSGEIPNTIGDAGLTFHESNEQELADRLLYLINDPEARQSLARRGRQRVLDHFTYEKVARERAEFYRRLCSEGGGNERNDGAGESFDERDKLASA
jgi:glycosyltransferase involved in cell wall biosynthesis